MAVLFCDTDCELWYTTARDLGLKVIGMPYTVNGEEKLYDLGENTDFVGFFNQMKAGATVTTSGLNFDTYYEIFEPYFEKGEDILYIAFSSKMSNTFEPMQKAVDELSAKYPSASFRRFDTLNISMGAGLMVYMAAKFFNENGGDVDKTYNYLDSILNNIGIYFVVDDLKYLARGGRLSPSKAGMVRPKTPAAVTRSAFMADRQRAKTASPIRVKGTPSSKAEMAVHLPVPFCPAVSRI